jgi:hypothetical protein
VDVDAQSVRGRDAMRAALGQASAVPVTHDDHQPMLPRTRREALKTFGAGLGMTYFAALAGQPLAAASSKLEGNPWAPKQPHFAPKAKNVIVVFLRGGL